MGFFTRTRETSTTPVTLPTTDSLRAGANNAVAQAKGFYQRNPNLVHGIGLVASAILLSRMRRGSK
ncbi:MAG: hypothetical protein ABIQ72_16425 [Usitatibacter sp.]